MPTPAIASRIEKELASLVTTPVASPQDSGPKSQAQRLSFVRHRQRHRRTLLQTMRHFAHAFLAIAVAALVAPIVVATPAFAQVAMPDATQMSGIPLPAGDLPVGTISVRVFRERVGNNISGQSVSVTVSGKTKTATTDAQGRAEFPGFKPGDVAVATTTVDGEILASQEITVPSRGGTRVALVAGAKAAAAKAQAEAEAAAKEPARQGVVVIGGDSRIIFEFQSDVLTVFYILEILNNARTRIDSGRPLDFPLPSGAAPADADGREHQRRPRCAARRCASPARSRPA